MFPSTRLVWRRCTGTPDDGFTMVEVLVAMVIVAVVMASMIGVLLSALTTVVQARQRQTATALGTQALEQLRALPYDDITQDNAAFGAPDLGLEQITGSDPYDFEPTTVLPGVDERLVVNEYSGRWEDIAVDEVTYRVSTYVTRPAIAAGASQTFNLTTLVTWTSAAYPDARTAAQRSTTFSPAGCLSTAQSPFAAPCQAYFTGQAGAALGGITISNPDNSTALIDGFDGSGLELSLAGLSTSLLVEQTASANSTATTTGAASSSASPGASGGQTAAVAVDSDPSSVPGQEVEQSTSQTTGTVSLSGTGGTLTVGPSTGDAGQALAAVAADTSYCVGTSGSGLATGSAGELRPCASSWIRPNGSAAHVTWEPEAMYGFASVEVPIVEMSGSPSPFRAVAAQLATNNIGACTSGTGPGALGCAHAASARELGDVRMGAPGAGAVMTPVDPMMPVDPDWDNAIGLWSVDDLTETARAEEGNGAGAPSYARSGDLWVWNGTGYTHVELDDYDAPGSPGSESWTIPATGFAYTSALGQVITLIYEGTVTVTRPEIGFTPATRPTGDVTKDCKADACVSSVNGGSSVVGNVEVTIVRGTDLDPTTRVVIGRFAVAANLGGMIAQASYKAAPNA